jgi:hypothetical protein
MPSVLVIVCGSMLGWRMRSEMVNSYSLIDCPLNQLSGPRSVPLHSSCRIYRRTSNADSVCTGRRMSLIDSGSRREADSAAIGCWLNCPAPIASARVVDRLGSQRRRGPSPDR